MSWVWLGQPLLDFGQPDPDELDGERIVWLYADPYRVLGARPSAGADELQRAYRRAARASHPDASSGTTERFHELQQALGVATGEAEITVEPVSGDWWSFTGFAPPAHAPPAHALPQHALPQHALPQHALPQHGGLAVAGLCFELHDLYRVPLRNASESIRVGYAGRSLPLEIGFARSMSSARVWRARLAVGVEAAVLLLLCLVLVPVLALLAAADLYLLSGANAVVAWGSIALIVGLGYGALAAILAGLGRTVPTPRRAVWRARTAVGRLRELGAGR